MRAQMCFVFAMWHISQVTHFTKHSLEMSADILYNFEIMDT